MFNDLANFYVRRNLKIDIYFANFLCIILLSFELEGIFGKKILNDLANLLRLHFHVLRSFKNRCFFYKPSMHQILSLESEGIFRMKIFNDLANFYVRRNLKIDIYFENFLCIIHIKFWVERNIWEENIEWSGKPVLLTFSWVLKIDVSFVCFYSPDFKSCVRRNL